MISINQKKINDFFLFKNENSKTEILIIKFNVMKNFRLHKNVFWKNVLKKMYFISVLWNLLIINDLIKTKKKTRWSKINY